MITVACKLRNFEQLLLVDQHEGAHVCLRDFVETEAVVQQVLLHAFFNRLDSCCCKDGEAIKDSHELYKLGCRLLFYILAAILKSDEVLYEFVDRTEVTAFIDTQKEVMH